MDQYVADFETSTDAWLNIDNGIARVWASCMVTVSDDPMIVSMHNNIDDFMKDCIKLGNIEVFFHNLKYDGEYILAWLFNNGYTYSQDPKEKKTFNVIISESGAWYEILVTHKVYNKKYIRTRFHDSYKKIPLKVSAIAKAFKLSIMKGEIDYDRYRPIGYEMDDVEKDYIINDCSIVAQALHVQFSKGLDKLTIGSDALSWFKEDIGGSRAFDYLFPELPIDIDNDIRLSYRGGFTRANPKYTNKVLSGFNVDVNSLYPAVMYGKMGALPYGIPRKYEGKYEYDRKYPLYIQKIHVSFKLKKGMIPTIQDKHNFMFKSTEYIEDSKGIIDLVLTGVDLELLKQHYDILYIDYICGYKFKGATTIFKDYIDYWMQIKANSEGGERQLAKLMLNSLYGKFGTNPKRINKIPIIDEDNTLCLIVNDPELQAPIYTALASYVTSYARAYTISNSQALYKYWIYSDTDSMYLTGITEEEARKILEIHPSNLGAWKVEHHFTSGKWLRAKTYILDSIEDGLSISCAGMPDNIKDTILERGKDYAFKHFTYGSTFDGKLLPKRVKGGVVLAKSEFTIKGLTA